MARTPQGIHPEPETESRELSAPSSSSCSRGVRGGQESSFKSHRSGHYRVLLVPLSFKPPPPPYSFLLETDPMGAVIFSAPLLFPFLLRRRQTSTRHRDEILSPGEQTSFSGSAAALR